MPKVVDLSRGWNASPVETVPLPPGAHLAARLEALIARTDPTDLDSPVDFDPQADLNDLTVLNDLADALTGSISHTGATEGGGGAGPDTANGVCDDPDAQMHDADARVHGAGAGVDDAALLAAIVDAHRLVSWAQALEIRLTAWFATRRPAGPLGDALREHEVSRWAADELACALTLTARGGENRLALAVRLVEQLPKTLAALSAGEIDFAKAKVIEEETQVIDEGARRRVEGAVLGRAGRQTTGQLRKAVQRAALAADPDGFAKRRKEVVKERRMEVHPHPSGTADLALKDVPAEHAMAAGQYVGALAAGLKGAGDGRTMNQLCSDVALALLMGIPQRHLAAPTDLPEPSTPTGPAGPGDPSDPYAPAAPSDLCDLADLPEPVVPFDLHDLDLPDRPEGRLAARGRAGSPVGRAGDRTGAAPCPPPGGERAGADGSRDSARHEAALRQERTWAGGRQGSAERAQGMRGPTKPGPTKHKPDQQGQNQQRPAVPPAGEQPEGDTGDETANRGANRNSGHDGGDGGIVWPAEVMQKITDRVAGQVGKVNLVIPITTWLGLADIPADVPGFGPILAGIARDLADNADKARWCYTLTGEDGQPLHYGEIGYRPPGRLRRQIEAFNPSCTHPGCDRPAERCDLDHTVPHDQGGLTCEHNLHPTCRRHHRVKQSPGWELIQINPGVYLYVTPTGQPILVGPGQNPTMN